MPEIFQMDKSPEDEVLIGRYRRNRGITVYPQVSVSSDYTVLGSDDTIFVDTTSNNVTITLPDGRNGQRFTIIRTSAGSNALTIQGTSQDIRGGTVSMASQYDKETFQFLTDEWY